MLKFMTHIHTHVKNVQNYIKKHTHEKIKQKKYLPADKAIWLDWNTLHPPRII